ncbi:MAG: DegT/DnrJ/EryC1/StrS aminotransferase family protein [Planctomycetaceae bacterium]
MTTSPDITPIAPWPHFDHEMIDAATRVLQSGKVNYWTGTEGRRFEEEYAEYTQTQHAIALSNGTVALELALYALNIGPGDDVIVPSRTFIASASCAVARGARPIVADVDRDSQNLTADTIEAVLTPQTKAIIAVHLAGWPCDMDPILELARARGIAVIEDCAQAHGAEYKGQPVGSIGDFGAFSFCQDKILTTAGEGGMLVTNNSDWWDRAWRFKDHGKTPEAFYNPQPPSTQFRWLHESFGTNMRLTEYQSAIGRIMLRRLPAWVETRRANASRLLAACQQSSALRTPVPGPNFKHAYYKFYTFIRPEQLAPDWSRDRILSEIKGQGVPVFTGSCSEIYKESAFPPAWKPPTPLPTAAELGQTSLMFQVHPTMTNADINRLSTGISRVGTMASLNESDINRAPKVA